MAADRPGSVAIIGAGNSGTALLAELTRRAVPAMLIEGSGQARLGAAYATEEPAHLLNVRADVMTARLDNSMAKVKFWEIIAVPNIRVQVAAVADDIAKELDQ